MRTAALGLAAALLLAGCATTVEEPRDAGRDRIIQRQRLVWIIGEEYPFIWDPEVASFVGRIGARISRAIGVSENSFHVYVIDQPTTNAFTTPYGDIFVFSGMLARMHNSSELAGVLAHEIGHVRADHFAQLQKKAALGTIPGLMAAILSRGDPAVIATAIAAAQSYQLHWSREMEIESDRLALQYLARTPYDPEGLLGALEVIEKGERLMPVGDVPEGLLSHPVISSRIAEMEGGLGIEPGKKYEPKADPGWERMRAVLTALTERPDVVRQRYDVPLEGGTAEAHHLAGVVFSKLGDYPAAETHLRRALESKPGDRQVLADLGVALFQQGRMDEARGALLESLEGAGGEGSAYAHYYLGEISFRDGEAEAAFREMQKAVDSWPPLSEANYRLALMLTGRDKLGQADYYFGKAARLRGDFASALRSFARAEGRLGNDPSWSTRIAEEKWRMQ